MEVDKALKMELIQRTEKIVQIMVQYRKKVVTIEPEDDNEGYGSLFTYAWSRYKHYHYERNYKPTYLADNFYRI